MFIDFIDFTQLKSQKKGLISTRPAEVDVARSTRADATQHARPHGRAARAHAAPRWRGDGADAWQGPRESTRMPRSHHVAV